MFSYVVGEMYELNGRVGYHLLFYLASAAASSSSADDTTSQTSSQVSTIRIFSLCPPPSLVGAYYLHPPKRKCLPSFNITIYNVMERALLLGGGGGGGWCNENRGGGDKQKES